MEIESWEFLEILGIGGMCTVHKVRNIHTNDIMAIKSLNKNLCDDKYIRQRFWNEFLIMMKLDHPNIVKVYNFYEKLEAMYMLMEYVKGYGLNKIIGEKLGPIPYQGALPLFNQIAEGLSYAHSKAVIHRDIKPSNILVTSDNVAKITDFGIAKSEEINSRTKTGTKLGTLYYMSPEQIEGKHAEEVSDIYSFGMTLYEMLAGKLPFSQEDCKSEFTISKTIIEKNFPPPTEFCPYIPDTIVNAVMKALSKKKEQRFSSVEEFRQSVNEGGTVITDTKYDPNPYLKPRPKIDELPPTVIESPVEEVNFKFVKIGSQVWSAENLNVERFRNGDIIPEAKSNQEWKAAGKNRQPAWCYYDNSIENGKKYGKLYNWYAVNDRRGLAPEGWHIPTKEEFMQLKQAVNGNGNSLKAIGVGVGCKSLLGKLFKGDGLGTNKSGFSALLSGYRNYNGYFSNLGYYTDYWSSAACNETSTYGLYLTYCNSSTDLNNGSKVNGFSVRVVEDY